MQMLLQSQMDVHVNDYLRNEALLNSFSEAKLSNQLGALQLFYRLHGHKRTNRRVFLMCRGLHYTVYLFVYLPTL